MMENVINMFNSTNTHLTDIHYIIFIMFICLSENQTSVSMNCNQLFDIGWNISHKCMTTFERSTMMKDPFCPRSVIVNDVITDKTKQSNLDHLGLHILRSSDQPCLAK